MDCSCNVCKRSRGFEDIVSKLQSEDDKKFMRDIFEDYIGAEEDCLYWRLKAEGTWDDKG
jgi:hypothetical protein